MIMVRSLKQTSVIHRYYSNTLKITCMRNIWVQLMAFHQQSNSSYTILLSHLLDIDLGNFYFVSFKVLYLDITMWYLIWKEIIIEWRKPSCGTDPSRCLYIVYVCMGIWLSWLHLNGSRTLIGALQKLSKLPNSFTIFGLASWF